MPGPVIADRVLAGLLGEPICEREIRVEMGIEVPGVDQLAILGCGKSSSSLDGVGHSSPVGSPEIQSTAGRVRGITDMEVLLVELQRARRSFTAVVGFSLREVRPFVLGCHETAQEERPGGEAGRRLPIKSHLASASFASLDAGLITLVASHQDMFRDVFARQLIVSRESLKRRLDHLVYADVVEEVLTPSRIE